MNRQSLTVREAAQLIYGSAPTAEQIGNVLRKMKRGELEATRKHGRWTTSEDQIANYLARQALRQRQKPDRMDAIHSVVGQPSPPRGSGQRLQSTYKSMLREYFLALLFRRRKQSASKRFRQAVTVGQVVGLLLLVVTFCLALRGSIWASEPPEHLAVKDWIEENLGPCTVTKWFEPTTGPQGRGQLVRVQFSYFRKGRKKIDSELVFLVVNGKVESADSSPTVESK